MTVVHSGASCYWKSETNHLGKLLQIGLFRLISQARRVVKAALLGCHLVTFWGILLRTPCQ